MTEISTRNWHGYFLEQRRGLSWGTIYVPYLITGVILIYHGLMFFAPNFVSILIENTKAGRIGSILLFYSLSVSLLSIVILVLDMLKVMSFMDTLHNPEVGEKTIEQVVQADAEWSHLQRLSRLGIQGSALGAACIFWILAIIY